MTARVAIIGDLSGYLAPLIPTLEELGIDLDSGEIPADLTVIQVGDLVHRGPDSDAIVALVDRCLERSEGRWIQLVGNHEAMHLGGPVFRGCNCSGTSVAAIQGWAEGGKLRLAASVQSVNLDPLVTHAGLGRPAWRELGKPSSAVSAAAALNAFLVNNPRAALQSGIMLEGGSGWSPPGVAWAHGPVEVYATWWEYEPPFDQIHGHVNAYLWAKNAWADNMADELRDASKLDHRRRFTATEVGGRTFIGIDPGFTARSRAERIYAYKVLGSVG